RCAQSVSHLLRQARLPDPSSVPAAAPRRDPAHRRRAPDYAGSGAARGLSVVPAELLDRGRRSGRPRARAVLVARHRGAVLPGASGAAAPRPPRPLRIVRGGDVDRPAAPALPLPRQRALEAAVLGGQAFLLPLSLSRAGVRRAPDRAVSAAGDRCRVRARGIGGDLLALARAALLAPRSHRALRRCRRSRRRHAAGVTAGVTALQRNASAIALPISEVLALPPMSRVRGPSRTTVSMARTTASPACLSPRCSSIMAPDQICPTGLAMPWPAISGADPCTGSNIEGYSRSGLRLADGAIPMVPVTAGPRSERMSPNRFDPTTTSKRSGRCTKCAQ